MGTFIKCKDFDPRKVSFKPGRQIGKVTGCDIKYDYGKGGIGNLVIMTRNMVLTRNAVPIYDPSIHGSNEDGLKRAYIYLNLEGSNEGAKELDDALSKLDDLIDKDTNGRTDVFTVSVKGGGSRVLKTQGYKRTVGIPAGDGTSEGEGAPRCRVRLRTAWVESLGDEPAKIITKLYKPESTAQLNAGTVTKFGNMLLCGAEVRLLLHVRRVSVGADRANMIIELLQALILKEGTGTGVGALYDGRIFEECTGGNKGNIWGTDSDEDEGELNARARARRVKAPSARKEISDDEDDDLTEPTGHASKGHDSPKNEKATRRKASPAREEISDDEDDDLAGEPTGRAKGHDSPKNGKATQRKAPREGEKETKKSPEGKRRAKKKSEDYDEDYDEYGETRDAASASGGESN